MANQEHLDRLRQGVEVWNSWRWESIENLRINPDLSGAILSGINLQHADLSRAYLNNADLSGAILSYADLSGSIFNGANLTGTYLLGVRALGTKFQGAILTGACIAFWNINQATDLQDVVCDYIFLGSLYDERTSRFYYTDRRPHDVNQIFAPGEFTKRYQIALETVDLFFNGGIDWKAFLASLQELQTQYGDELNIQGIEKKSGGTFLVRLEVPSDADKGEVERQTKDLYETKLQLLDACYQAELQAKDGQISLYREQLEWQRQNNTNLMEIVKTMAEKEPMNQTIINSPGNIGFINSGSGTVSDYSQNISQNLDDITRLITSLRRDAQTFPEETRKQVIVQLEDLEEDIRQPSKRKPDRMKTRLLTLLGIALGMGSAVATATDFTNNVLELSDKLGVSSEQIQTQLQHLDTTDDRTIKPEKP